MSDTNRQRLLNGLAKIRALSLRGFKRQTPKATSFTFTPAAPMFISIGGSKTLVSKEAVFTRQLSAGDIVYIHKSEQSATWQVDFRYDNGGTATVRGRLNENDVKCQFLVPLPTPYRYSTPIKSALGLQSDTLGVSGYPDCR